MIRMLLVVLALLLGVVSTATAQRFESSARTFTAQDQCVTLDVRDMATAEVTIANAFTGTIAWTTTNTDGDWTPVVASSRDTVTVGVTTTTTTGTFVLNVSAARTLRACATALAAGTPRVTLSAASAGAGGGDVTSGGVELASESTAAAMSGLLASIDTAISSLATNQGRDQTEGTAPTYLSGPFEVCKYADHDGAALPLNASVDTEGDPVIAQCSSRGIRYSMLVSEDGATDVGGALVTALGLLAPTTSASAAVTPCYIVTTASTNATNCKNAAGNFYGARLINTTATLGYLRLYNLASAPTCSSATGFVESIPIPASTSGNGFVAFQIDPINYTTGISWCITGGGSSTDNTNTVAGIYGAVLTK